MRTPLLAAPLVLLGGCRFVERVEQSIPPEVVETVVEHAQPVVEAVSHSLPGAWGGVVLLLGTTILGWIRARMAKNAAKSIVRSVGLVVPKKTFSDNRDVLNSIQTPYAKKIVYEVKREGSR